MKIFHSFHNFTHLCIPVLYIFRHLINFKFELISKSNQVWLIFDEWVDLFSSIRLFSFCHPIGSLWPIPVPFPFDRFETMENMYDRLRMNNIFLKYQLYVSIESRGRATSDIFVKEPEGSWEKILKYVNCTYGIIPGPSQKNKFMI